MIEIDGSIGEGGGQVLRSALTLAILTNQGVHLTNIRARRPKPGLKPQHLKAVDAAAAISKAQVEGATLNSQELIFLPSELHSGRYKFDIGTAGATTLVLQTIFLPLSLAAAASSVIITGGTHVPWSPCYHYLEFQWLPYLKRIGFNAQLSLEQAGFYPQGGGRISASIRPVNQISPLNLVERGALLRVNGLSAVANLNINIAERQKRQALGRLQKFDWGTRRPEVKIKITQLPSPYKGTLLILLAEFESGRCCYYGLGALGKPAERVADDAIDSLLAFVDTDAVIDQYLADQLLLPLCLAGGESQIHTCQITQHLLTNIAVLQAFLPVTIAVQGDLGQPGLVRILPISS